MGKPFRVYTLKSYDESNSHSEGKPANWNILVAGRKENNNDSQSSGERNGKSLNPLCVIACERCIEGVVGLIRNNHSYFKELQNWLLVEYNWKVEP